MGIFKQHVEKRSSNANSQMTPTRDDAAISNNRGAIQKEIQNLDFNKLLFYFESSMDFYCPAHSRLPGLSLEK